MTQGMTEEPILQMGTDKLIPRHVYDKPFTVRFPEKRERKDRFQPDRKGDYSGTQMVPRQIKALGL
jgi:hypothetical protein